MIWWFVLDLVLYLDDLAVTGCFGCGWCGFVLPLAVSVVSLLFGLRRLVVAVALSGFTAGWCCFTDLRWWDGGFARLIAFAFGICWFGWLLFGQVSGGDCLVLWFGGVLGLVRQFGALKWLDLVLVLGWIC